MTYRDFYTAVLASTVSDDLKAFAKDALAALDTKAAKRKVSPSALAAKAAKDAFTAKVLDALTDKLQTAAQVAVAVGESTAKTAYTLGVLVKDGSAVTEQFKPTGKGRKVTGYALAPVADDTDDGDDTAEGEGA